MDPFTGAPGPGGAEIISVGVIFLVAMCAFLFLRIAGRTAWLLVFGGLVIPIAVAMEFRRNVTIPVRSWHGLGATLQLAGGTLDVALAPGFSGDIDANVLRLGEIKNSYPGLAPREDGGITARLMQARSGAGGARISFTVGDGIIEIKPSSSSQ